MQTKLFNLNFNTINHQFGQVKWQQQQQIKICLCGFVVFFLPIKNIII